MYSFRFLLCTLFLVGSLFSSSAQNHKDEVITFQKELNDEFSDSDKSPLTKKEQKKFQGHNFFAVDESFCVKAKFTRFTDPMTISLKTTNSRLSAYDLYGELTFELKEKTVSLYVYQSHRLRNIEEYRDHLFLPFTDTTNGHETYGGGRYLDMEIPQQDSVVIDFNKAYSPYCAYNAKYSCPIPPIENDIDLRITAGVQNLK